MRRLLVAAALIVTTAMGSPASAAEVVITNLDSPLPARQSWGTLPGENTGTIAITGAAARSGTGSIEIRGDRTRAQTGVQYGGAFASNITLLDNAKGLTFDYQIASDSQRLDYSPALRLLVQDGSQRSELIWEAVYNGGAAAAGTWASTSTNDLFYQFRTGLGANEFGGSLQLMTIAQWAASAFYTDTARVSGLSVGAGSGAGAAYHGFVDNVTLTRADGTATTYNFEVVSAVPEPETWAMMLVGFGAVGFSMRRGKKPKDAFSAAYDLA